MSSIKPYKVGVCKICRQSGDREDKPLIGNLCYTAEPFHYQKHQEEKTAGYIEKDTERKRKKHLEANKQAFQNYRSKNLYIELKDGETGDITIPVYKRTSIKKVSTKRAKQLAEYEVEKKKYFDLKPICEYPGCVSTEITLHHMGGRTGLLLIDSRYFKSLCLEHHAFVELNPEEAKRLGLSLDRLTNQIEILKR